MISPIEIVRVNRLTWGWSSCHFSVDGFGTQGVVAVDYEDELETRAVYSNQQDGAPLGWATGRYKVAVFTVKMLSDAALALKTYLTAQALKSPFPSSSFGQAVFTFAVQLAGTDSATLVPTSTVFSSCRIVGESTSRERGTGVAVTTFRIGCLLILQDGQTLWNATPPLVGGFPAVDTITIGGVQAPGKWTLEKADRVFGWQERKGFGLSGATVVPTGDELVKPEFAVEFWDPADWALFQPFRALYLKKALVGVPGALAGMALGIDHPELKAQGVASVVVASVSIFKNDGFGVWTGKVNLIQYRGPQPAPPKPEFAIPDLIDPVPTAQNAEEREAQALSAQLKAQPGPP